METTDYLLAILGFSLAYVVVSFYALFTKNQKIKESIAMMVPTLFVSIVAMCLTGLGYIK